MNGPNAKADVMEEVLRAVECPVCLQNYASSDTPKKGREARVLTCSHMICGSCLDRLQPNGNNRLGCPICRQKIKTRDLPILKEAAFIAEKVERFGAANAEVKKAHETTVQAMQNRIDVLEQQMRATAIGLLAAADQPIAVVAAPAALVVPAARAAPAALAAPAARVVHAAPAALAAPAARVVRAAPAAPAAARAPGVAAAPVVPAAAAAPAAPGVAGAPRVAAARAAPAAPAANAAAPAARAARAAPVVPAARAAPAAAAAGVPSAKKASSNNDEFEYKELKRFKVLKTVVNVEVEWEGDWGDEQTTFEKLENVPKGQDLLNLIKKEHDTRPTYFTHRVRGQFQAVHGYDILAMFKE